MLDIVLTYGSLWFEEAIDAINYLWLGAVLVPVYLVLVSFFFKWKCHTIKVTFSLALKNMLPFIKKDTDDLQPK